MYWVYAFFILLIVGFLASLFKRKLFLAFEIGAVTFLLALFVNGNIEELSKYVITPLNFFKDI